MMKLYFTSLCLIYCISVSAQNSIPTILKFSPLAVYSREWNKPEYARCNTAENVNYMSAAEKNMIYVLNLVRANPKLFVNTVLLKYPGRSGQDHLLNDSFYFQSLVKTLLVLKPLSILQPDKECYSSAHCHALLSGISGYVGHERQNIDCERITYFNGECCDYGHNDPVDIILSLLIDEGVESLGHRSICLGEYEKLGVSVQPHKVYGYNAVLDLHF